MSINGLSQQEVLKGVINPQEGGEDANDRLLKLVEECLSVSAQLERLKERRGLLIQVINHKLLSVKRAKDLKQVHKIAVLALLGTDSLTSASWREAAAYMPKYNIFLQPDIYICNPSLEALGEAKERMHALRKD